MKNLNKLFLLLLITLFTIIPSNRFAIGLDDNSRFFYLDMHQGFKTYLDKSSLVLLQNDSNAIIFAYTTTTTKPDGTISRYSQPITLKHNWSDPVNIVYGKYNNSLWSRLDMDITAHYMWSTKRAFCSGYEMLLGQKYPYTPKYTR